MRPLSFIINNILKYSIAGKGKVSSASGGRPARGGRRRGVIMIIERTEYKGQPVIILKRNENDRYPFSFGLGKARMILESIEDIKKFVEENDNKEEKKD